jgi:hypothetical protein
MREDFDVNRSPREIGRVSVFGEGKGHGNPDNEEEGGKNQVCGGEPMPCCMAEGGINLLPDPGIINPNHGSDRHPGKHI